MNDYEGLRNLPFYFIPLIVFLCLKIRRIHIPFMIVKLYFPPFCSFFYKLPNTHIYNYIIFILSHPIQLFNLMIYAFNSLHYLLNFLLELEVRGKVFVQNFKIEWLHNTIILNMVWTTTTKIYFKYYKLKFLSIKSHKPNLQALTPKRKNLNTCKYKHKQKSQSSSK